MLEDGSEFYGYSIGVEGETVGEIVFNTALTGYQEILTDPSYCRQIVTLTYPHIGNTGINAEDAESDKIWCAGLVLRDLPKIASNWRSQESLASYLQAMNIVAIAGIDTRRLTRILREKGAQKACIVAGSAIDKASALTQATSWSGLRGQDLAKVVTTPQSYQWQQGSWQLGQGFKQYAVEALPYHIVAYDFGVKKNILRLLVDHGCRITVVPAQTPAEEVLALAPDGVFLSNGPGDPKPCDYAQQAIQFLLEKGLPLFGICLGHQLLALACGAQSIKMKFGHHGANHPVIDLTTKKVMISSQNHGFAVDEASLPANLEPTHRSLFDQSLQGIQHQQYPAFGFQGHPEASPGPHDVKRLFQQFIQLIQSSG